MKIMYFDCAMNKKNHSRAADKRGFSVAIPIVLRDEIAKIADLETRSRNKQIEHFLTEAVKSYYDANRKSSSLGLTPLPSPKVNAIKAK